MSSAPKLYEIAAELATLIDFITESGGELDPATEEALDAIQMGFDDKAENVILAIRTNEARAKMIDSEIDRLKSLRDPYMNAARSLKGYLEAQMRAADRRKVEGKLTKAWFQRSPPSVVYTGEPEDLPDRFQRVSVAVDKRELLAAHDRDEMLPAGVTVVQNEHLRIK